MSIEKPKILQIHNRYLRLGGEDTVLAEEFALLRDHGHAVEQLIVTNEGNIPRGAMVALTGLKTVWSHDGYQKVTEAIQRSQPDLVHIHNTFPLLSPSVYWAAQKQNVPVVQTLHNYRLACANGLLLRDGLPCEACVGHLPTPALRYRCYKDSLAATGSLVAMQTVNRALGSYRSKVDAYIALTQFAKTLMIRAGLPADKVHVKPNFIADTLAGNELPVIRKRQIVFIGRIDKEKGVDLLVQAWTTLKPPEYQLIIFGDGPERAVLELATAEDHSIEWRGHVERQEVLEEVGCSRYLVLSSRWYEGFPMVLLEALCAGVPAIVPNLGAMPEIIADGTAGLIFTGGDTVSLRQTLAAAVSLPDADWTQKAQTARQSYQDHYSPQINYTQLMAIYEAAAEAPSKTR